MNLEMRLYTLLPLPPCGMWPEKGQRRGGNCGAKNGWGGLWRGRRPESKGGSYTTLTLPTKREGEIAGGGA